VSDRRRGRTVRTLRQAKTYEGTKVAHQTSVTLVDDLDGGKAAETVAFSLDGASYEIDLSKKNAAALRKAVAEFVENGRRIRRGPPLAKGIQKRSFARTGPSPAAVREWATSQGIAVSPRGRISTEVVTQYDAAQS